MENGSTKFLPIDDEEELVAAWRNCNDGTLTFAFPILLEHSRLLSLPMTHFFPILLEVLGELSV